MVRSTLACALALVMLVAVAGEARAEGSLGPELDSSQALRMSTSIHADVLDSTVETIVWTGKGDVDVFDPSGTMVGTFASGATIDPTMNGDYRIVLLENQFDFLAGSTTNIDRASIVPWDVTVFVSGTPTIGRVFSFEWAFNTGGFDVAASTDARFYARVPGGDDESFAVVELRTDGLAGFIFEIQGNSTGVRGANAGRSVPETGNSAANEYRIYLNPPDNATYSHLEPSVDNFRFVGGLESSDPVPDCDEFVPGMSDGAFIFDTDVAGSFHLVCDLNEDGVFDIVDDGDFLILGNTVPGENTVPFDGLDNNDNPFSLGGHECRVRVTVGEFHYVGRDIETSFEGLRMFEVDASGGLSSLQMYWNDALVQANAVPMPAPYAFISARTSGPAGLDSGDPTAAPVPLGETMILAGANSRAWGDFVSVGGMGNGKGNVAYLDTYTWLSEAVSTTVTINAVDGTIDTDGEGVTDYVERCITGTDPMNPDSDDDLVDDFVETGGGMPGLDLDMDGLVDALDDNDDGDCILTRDEDVDGDGDPTNDNADGDASPDYRDPDDDGDGLPTCMEDPDGDGDPRNDDTDGDGVPNYLDEDSDGDCQVAELMRAMMCLDGVDACPLEAESENGIDDEDGCPEPDMDMDGIPDNLDNCIVDPNFEQEDFDEDGLGDACDDDIDGDGLLNECEGVPDGTTCPLSCTTGCADTDPFDPDSDDGGVLDGPEVERGSNPLDPIDDPLPGTLTGGGVFTCAAEPGRDGSSPLPFAAFLFALMVWRLRRSR